jgi:hypothetical protein
MTKVFCVRAVYDMDSLGPPEHWVHGFESH